ncbi:hypothetical protein PSTT_10575 [Puccinia striiformis]|uniref:Uncharacterized protein n=1 Tax=Puccinia striiformis TaxID=27350 RepID=A0A2S4V415_9BASI|nr:hypothetical protein PSTT_10575 [Puccinia striiformis]
MSTRRTVSADQLLPLADPEAILRQARAERRRLAQQLLPFLTTEDPPPDATNPSLIPLPHSPTVPATAETTNQPLPLPTIIEPTRAPHRQSITRSTTPPRHRSIPRDNTVSNTP